MKCKVGKICGGCAYLSKSMEEQASIKKAQVEELAQRNHLKLRVGDVLTWAFMLSPIYKTAG